MKRYALKLYKNNKEVEKVSTKKKKRFFKILRTINWQFDDIKKAYLKVSYGKKICIDKCLCEFSNEAYSDNYEELLQTFKYFDYENQ